MTKVLDPAIPNKIKALSEFSKLIEKFRSEGLDRDHADYYKKRDALFKMQGYLNCCITEFKRIDDSSSHQFDAEIQCLNMTHSLIFEDSSQEKCQAYIDHSKALLSSTQTKKRLASAMEWLGLITLILSPLLCLIVSPIGFAVAGVVGFVAFVAFATGTWYANHYDYKRPMPIYTELFGQHRASFFSPVTDQENNQTDTFDKSFKQFCYEHQEFKSENLDEEFNQFFAEPQF